MRHPLCPLNDKEKVSVIAKWERLGLVHARFLAVKHGNLLAAFQFLNRHKIGILKQFRRNTDYHSTAIAHSTVSPDWNDYPRSVLLGSVTDKPSQVKISLVFSCLTFSESLKVGIGSALVQSLRELEILLPESVELGITQIWMSDPRIRFFAVDDVSSDWSVFNTGAKVAQGEFIKFIGPDAFLYPYALDFEYAAITAGPGQALLVEGDIGFSVFHPLTFSPQETLSLEVSGCGYLLRSDISCCLVRRDTFLKHGGFDSTWEEWASFVLLLEIAIQMGVMQGLWALSSKWKLRSAVNFDLPDSIKNHVEKLCQHSWGSPTSTSSWYDQLAEQWVSCRGNIEHNSKLNLDYFAWCTNKLIITKNERLIS
jgi:hypothetical protein